MYVSNRYPDWGPGRVFPGRSRRGQIVKAIIAVQRAGPEASSPEDYARARRVLQDELAQVKEEEEEE